MLNASFNFKQIIKKSVYLSLRKHLIEAWRISLTIILPVASLFKLHMPNAAIYMGIGSLLISLIDYPGAWPEKNKAFRFQVLSFLVISFLTSVTLRYPVLLCGVIFLCSFSSALLGAFGKRWASVGSVGVVLMIFVIALKPHDSLQFSGLIALGGMWSYLVSFIVYRIRPLRSVEHVVRECLLEMSRFFTYRKMLYDPEVSLGVAYKQVIAGHEAVHEKQEAMRSFILYNGQPAKGHSKEFKNYLGIAIVMIDLYEQLRVMPSDYLMLRESLAAKDLLLIRDYIEGVADDLNNLSDNILRFKKGGPCDQALSLTHKVHYRFRLSAEAQAGKDHDLFKVLLKNMDVIVKHLESLRVLICSGNSALSIGPKNFDYSKFVNVNDIRFKDLLKFFYMRPQPYRFALRLSITLVMAYLLTVLLPLGQYSYWVMLTIALVLRPVFSVTHKRNKERLAGTLIGAILGLLFTLTVHSFSVQVLAIFACLVGFFCFLQISYTTSVIFITPLVIIGLSMVGGSNDELFLERLYDTMLGCSLSFAAGFIFPAWEVKNLKSFVLDLLKANIDYMENVLFALRSGTMDTQDYKLSRKMLYTSSAKLTATVKLIKKEPRKMTVQQESVEQIILLNYLLYASVLSIQLQFSNQSNSHSNKSYEEIIKSIINLLKTELSDAINPDETKKNEVFQPVALFGSNNIFMQWHASYIFDLATEVCFHIREISIE